MENDLLKRIESLEKELKLLKKDNLAMFGRTYSQIGDTKSDLVLNTRGLVKLRIGGKFIDLIKNGEINVDTDIIFTASDADSLGSKNGIYILDDGSVYLKYRDKSLNLVGETGTTYVSFLDTQETTAELKLQALHNIGFYCESLDLLESNIQNGIVYIESDLSLYVVKDGIGTKFMQVILDTINSILGEQESTKEEISLPFKVENNRIIFDKPLIINLANSSNATKERNGFNLYNTPDGDYILEIDKLVIHKELLGVPPHIDPRYWDNTSNIIKSVTADFSGDIDFSKITCDITLKYPSQYVDNQILYAYSFYMIENVPSNPIKLLFIIQFSENLEIVAVCNFEPFLLTTEVTEEDKQERIQELVLNLSNMMICSEDTHEQIPTGLITLYKANTVLPEGWIECNGENGTIDLTEYYLKQEDSEDILAIYITKV